MGSLLIVIIILMHIIENSMIATIDIPLGGIFEGPQQDNEIAFRVAVQRARNKLQLPFTPLIANINPEEVMDKHKTTIGITWDRPFATVKTACTFLESGVVGILSPLSENNANAVQSVCDVKEVPFIRTTPERKHKPECCSINLFPNVEALTRAFGCLIEKWEWKSFTIMYESTDALLNVGELFYNSTRYKVVLEQLHKDDYGDYKHVLKKIRKSGQKQFVLYCETKNLNGILEQAQQVGLMMRKYSYIIANLDMHTINLSPFQHSDTNISGLINPTNPMVIEIAQAMYEERKELGLQVEKIVNPVIDAWKIQTETALLVDAVMLFTETLKDVDDFSISRMSCNSTDNWEHGSTIFNFMKMKTINGLTGLVQFDQHGFRSDFSLDVIELKEGGITKVGSWNSREGMTISRVYERIDDSSKEEESLRNKSLNVMIAWSEPYALYKNDSATLKGNDQYEGFVVDLIEEIALLEGFTYTLIRNVDDKNGDYNETTKTWNGMIGDILNGTGDIAIGDLVITRQRQEFVDFTTPFMTSGIQILYKKPSRPTPRFFSFAGPFAAEVWLLIGVSYCVVSLGIYIMARFCPPEWKNWNSCIQNPEFYVNQFNFRNSLWYSLGCLMQQGADVAPRGLSTRILASIWAFFILVIVSYYKAQLAASLTIENKELPFKNAEELVERSEQLGIKYGAIEHEAIYTFFKRSPVELHQKIAAYMDAHPEYMAEDNYGGFLLIEEEDYAFFTESVFAQFVTTAVCYLTTVGPPINEQNFAIALKKGSPYRGVLSKAILHLLETGRIGQLQKRWWEDEKFQLEDCQQFEEISTVAPPLNYYHVAGIFWITLVGILAAYFFAFIELSVHIIKKGARTRKAFMEEFLAEVKFYFSFSGANKPMKNDRIATIRSTEQE